MRIFIDESGSFAYTDNHNAWSSVGAVVILDEAMGTAESALEQFKSDGDQPCLPQSDALLAFQPLATRRFLIVPSPVVDAHPHN
ncbi:hypothetical protein [Pseudomonas sp. PDM31]|uniref:hypothetical protein n=1 Tax=Pseudomonas sp. PDM31 TaxID=2854778 RepID=UPI001C4757D8|nr:hypothetical protein [Pseudomonas sp. PDM31]MBV7478312.1 hypothetical protein [Pseudomonas sp. PDM31]